MNTQSPNGAQATERAVLVEERDHVMVITINRPAARNAINLAVHQGIGFALEQAEADRQIRVIILTGAGDQAFSAGADLKALARGESLLPEDAAQRAWGFAGLITHHISKPVIGAVNGFALGGGTELALTCDLIVASDNAMFGLPEIKRGILAGAGGAFRLARQLPLKLAMELLLTGDSIDAQRALELGLVNSVVPRTQLMTAAMALAARISANAPLSVRATKRIALGIAEGKISSESADWLRTHEEFAAVMSSQDGREGVRAFAEKRAPVWQGR